MSSRCPATASSNRSWAACAGSTYPPERFPARPWRSSISRRVTRAHSSSELVSSVPVGDIADDVCARVTRLDMDDLHGRAGKRSGGYVEPAQAAQDLLEEAVAGHLDDMKRRMDLGLYEGAESVCAGIVLGLFHASRQKSGGMLEWAPDFPAEHAGYAIEEYLAGYPKSKRRGVGDRLSAALVASVSEWSDMIFKIGRAH